jgi:hypothetical protein
MEIDEIVGLVNTLETLNSKKEFVKFLRNNIDDFSGIFIGDYLNKMNSPYRESKNESTDDLFAKVHDELQKKSGFNFEPEDFSLFKIVIFFEIILTYFILDKHKFLSGRKLKVFDEVTALLKTIYALLSGSTELFKFRTLIVSSFNSYKLIHPWLTLGTKDEIKTNFFNLLKKEFLTLFPKR